jgi:DivIVA domain-containing protein
MSEASSNEDLENTTFSSALRGYDRDEVDSFVRTVAQEMRELHQGRTEKLYESLGEEMGGLLQHARDSADEMTRSAEEAAAETRAQAEAEAQRINEAARDRARALLEQAEQDATQARTEAEQDATQARTEAERDAAQTRSEAEQDATTRIAEATEKVQRLEATESETRIRLKALREELASITNDLRMVEATPETESVQELESGPRATGAQGEEPDDEEHRTIRLEPQESSIR